MSLYAIGDLHLHYQSVLRAPGQLHDRVWKKHEDKFRKNCQRLIRDEDTLVLVGDHSWGKNLAECERDLQYICDLPGRKILTRGNHDMFWDVKKTQQLNDLYQPRLMFLQKLMKRIAAGTLIVTVLLAILYHFYPMGVILSLAITAGTICYHFTMRLIVGSMYNLLMNNRADYRKSWYQQRTWEPGLYEKLQVKNWKGRMPTYDPDLFDPRKHSWDEIAQAMCQSELVHETIVVFSFLPIFASVWFGSIGASS